MNFNGALIIEPFVFIVAVQVIDDIASLLQSFDLVERYGEVSSCLLIAIAAKQFRISDTIFIFDNEMNNCTPA